MQFHSISNNFIHSYQSRGLKQISILDAGIFLIHIIYSGQVKNIQTSTLAFDITQVFLSLNYYLLPCILDKAGFNLKIVKFFSNYLIGRKTHYMQNKFYSPFFEVDVSVGQGSALLPILSALYILLLFYIFEKHAKNPVSLFSFIDNGLLVSQEKLLKKPICFYSIVTILFFHSQNNLI